MVTLFVVLSVLPVIKKPGEAKFYGPSLDLHVKDIHQRSWQCSSIQLDFNLPGRFKMHFFDEKNERQVPYIVHRAIFGSLERFIAILLENFGKNLPFWMHPVQYKILSVSEEGKRYINPPFQLFFLRDNGLNICFFMEENNGPKSKTKLATLL